MKMQPTKAFICYSHKDAKWHERLVVHLASLSHSNRLDVWSDTRIGTGDDWKSQIAESIDTCSIAILIVSADFFASKFIRNVELPAILKKAAEHGVKVVTLLAKPSSFVDEPLGTFKSANLPDETLLQLDEAGQEKILAHLAKEITQFLNARIENPIIEKKDQGSKNIPSFDDFNYVALQNAREVEDKEVFLPSLVRGVRPPRISGYKFKRCRLVGPAVLYLMPSALNSLIGCRFSGEDPNQILLPVEENKKWSGSLELNKLNLLIVHLKALHLPTHWRIWQCLRRDCLADCRRREIRKAIWEFVPRGLIDADQEVTC